MTKYYEVKTVKVYTLTQAPPVPASEVNDEVYSWNPPWGGWALWNGSTNHEQVSIQGAGFVTLKPNTGICVSADGSTHFHLHIHERVIDNGQSQRRPDN